MLVKHMLSHLPFPYLTFYQLVVPVLLSSFRELLFGDMKVGKEGRGADCHHLIRFPSSLC